VRTRSIARLVIVIAVGVSLCWALRGRQSHTRDLSVAFTGFTNRGAGEFAAVFCVTNGTPDPLYFELLSLEKRADNDWTPAPFSPDPRLDGIIWNSQSILRSVTVPSTNSEYRLRVAGVERRKGLSGMRDSFDEVYNRAVIIALLGRKGVTHKFLGRRYEVTGGEGAK
jgi:hypothetical protein